jgi:YHS domain-containing protein
MRIAFPYILFGLMLLGMVWANLRGGDGPTESTHSEQVDGGHEGHAHHRQDVNDDGVYIDPICKMEVNPAWGISHEIDGQTWYFCSDHCRLDFIENPDVRCTVCGKPVPDGTGVTATYLDTEHTLCSEAHRAEFKADPASFYMHTMWGIPSWLYSLSIALVLLASFLMFERKGGASAPARAPARLDLLRWAPLGWAFRSRPLRFAAQLVLVVLFLLIIAAGLFGHQNPALNLAPLLTWTVWWGGLVVVIMFFGKAWCTVCPWDALAGWMERLRFWRKTDSGLGLGLRWPRWGRNIVLATVLFVGLTWIELGFGVTMKPRATAWLGLAMLLMAIASAFVFERKSFCRYACLVGRVSGLYAMFSGIEYRARDQGTCDRCRSKECVKGSATAYACPTYEFPGGMSLNTYCIQCNECVQACPHDNMTVNLRPWGADLVVEGKPRKDEAYLALLMLSITGFHGLTMTPVWAELTGWLEGVLGVGRILSFSVGMLALMVAPLLVYAALVWLSHLIAKGSDGDFHDYFVRYAYCVLPIALFYHLAHNLEHLLMEGQKVIPLLSDPLGLGWNLFRTAQLTIPPLVSLDVLWIMQVVLVGVGHVYSLWVARGIARRSFSSGARAHLGQWPLLVGMILFSIFSLWLLKQPMEMRVSAM